MLPIVRIVAIAALAAAQTPPPDSQTPQAHRVAAGADLALVAPVDGVVVDRFDHAAGAYGAGNRGLDYSIAPNSTVRAPADGTVTFAGRVVDAVWITISHRDGLRSTVGSMESLAVQSGDVVTAGQLIGTATERLSFTVRLGDTYVDPERYLVAQRRRARLVPISAG